jgi:hypothetical protein
MNKTECASVKTASQRDALAGPCKFDGVRTVSELWTVTVIHSAALTPSGRLVNVPSSHWGRRRRTLAYVSGWRWAVGKVRVT